MAGSFSGASLSGNPSNCSIQNNVFGSAARTHFPRSRQQFFNVLRPPDRHNRAGFCVQTRSASLPSARLHRSWEFRLWLMTDDSESALCRQSLEEIDFVTFAEDDGVNRLGAGRMAHVSAREDRLLCRVAAANFVATRSGPGHCWSSAGVLVPVHL